ncbi:MAG: RAMP superfamily protein [Methanoregula sp. PtaU1.Bin051]|nr:MAG: RAMP superfamily protein [Methanoregula sp. PtaU1.Bin051]
MKTLHVKLTCTSDLHLGGQNQGSILDYLKLRKGEPYIPATHVKGIMRCEAERILRSTQCIPCAITGMAGDKDHGIHLCPELEKEGKYQCCICKLFGSPNIKGGEGCREGKIRVMNFTLETPDRVNSGLRTHVSIDRNKGRSLTGALYTVNTVSSGTVFSGDIIIREPLDENEETPLLLACIHAMADYGLGSERSRGLGRMKCSVAWKDNLSASYGGM